MRCVAVLLCICISSIIFAFENPLFDVIGDINGKIITNSKMDMGQKYLIIRDLNGDNNPDRIEFWNFENGMTTCRVDYSKMGEYNLELIYLESKNTIIGTFQDTNGKKHGVKYVNNKLLVLIDDKEQVLNLTHTGIEFK